MTKLKRIVFLIPHEVSRDHFELLPTLNLRLLSNHESEIKGLLNKCFNFLEYLKALLRDMKENAIRFNYKIDVVSSPIRRANAFIRLTLIVGETVISLIYHYLLY